MDREKRDLFTLKYEYFHFFSIKKKDLFTLKYSQAYTFKKLQYLFLLFIEIEHFHFFCFLILFPVKITRFYFIFNMASPKNGKCSHFAAEIQA